MREPSEANDDVAVDLAPFHQLFVAVRQGQIAVLILQPLGMLERQDDEVSQFRFERQVMPAIDRLVDIVKEAIGEAGGVRMTGGGFGGCVVALVPEELVEAARRLLQVRIAHVEDADGIFATLMGEVVEPRRDFIQENALRVVNLDA